VDPKEPTCCASDGTCDISIKTVIPISLFYSLNLYWSSLTSGDLWYKSGGKNKMICGVSNDIFLTEMVGESPEKSENDV
jgi:hypothetical protein